MKTVKHWEAVGPQARYVPEGLRFNYYKGADELEALRDFADTMKACGVLSGIRLSGITMREVIKK